MWMKILVGGRCTTLPEATIGSMGFQRGNCGSAWVPPQRQVARWPAPTMKGPSAYTAHWSSSFFFTLAYLDTIIHIVALPVFFSFNSPNQRQSIIIRFVLPTQKNVTEIRSIIYVASGNSVSLVLLQWSSLSMGLQLNGGLRRYREEDQGQAPDLSSADQLCSCDKSFSFTSVNGPACRVEWRLATISRRRSRASARSIISRLVASRSFVHCFTLPLTRLPKCSFQTGGKLINQRRSEIQNQ